MIATLVILYLAWGLTLLVVTIHSYKTSLLEDLDKSFIGTALAVLAFSVIMVLIGPPLAVYWKIKGDE